MASLCYQNTSWYLHASASEIHKDLATLELGERLLTEHVYKTFNKERSTLPKWNTKMKHDLEWLRKQAEPSGP